MVRYEFGARLPADLKVWLAVRAANDSFACTHRSNAATSPDLHSETLENGTG
jgi:hypothetical protein